MTDNQTPTDLEAPADVAPAEAADEAPAAEASAEDGSAEVVPAEEEAPEDAPADEAAAVEGPADVAAVEVPAEAVAEGVPVEGDVAALLDDVVVAEDAIDDVTMRRALEAILMVSDEPLPALALARSVGRAVADVTAALGGLAEEYTEQGRGFDLREVGGGWRYYTREDSAQYVEAFVLDGQQARLTQAALETLAVVAYKQPVSRARVSAIRGVNVDGVMRTLISRGLLEEAGPDTESQSTLYRTTSYFLERMGMQSLDDLPELAPYLPEMDDLEEELAAQTATAAEPAPAEEDNTPLENDLAPPTPEPTHDADETEPLDRSEVDEAELLDGSDADDEELVDESAVDAGELADESEVDDGEGALEEPALVDDAVGEAEDTAGDDADGDDVADGDNAGSSGDEDLDGAGRRG